MRTLIYYLWITSGYLLFFCAGHQSISQRSDHWMHFTLSFICFISFLGTLRADRLSLISTKENMVQTDRDKKKEYRRPWVNIECFGFFSITCANIIDANTAPWWHFVWKYDFFITVNSVCVNCHIKLLSVPWILIDAFHFVLFRLFFVRAGKKNQQQTTASELMCNACGQTCKRVNTYIIEFECQI